MTRDAEDQMLESLFAAEPIADDGFSNAVVRRIKRRLWVRRATLPAAAAIGASISVKPLAGLISSLYGVVASLPLDASIVPTDWFPPVHIVVIGGMLLCAVMLGMRFLEE